MKKSARPFVLVVSLGLMASCRTQAQTLKTLHDFTGGSDGATPAAGLILSNNSLYGTTLRGGSSASGTVFALNADGSGFRTLHSFTGNSDGLSPSCRLLLSGSTLYGTEPNGGTNLYGAVFALNIDGTGFTNVYSFTPRYYPAGTNSDGADPSDGLILSGNTLYGRSEVGGTYGYGTVFALNTDGTSFRTLYDFTEFSAPPSYTNSDGWNVGGHLLLSDNTLYGEASYGGSFGYGTVFALQTDGTGFRILHTFTSGSDGSRPTGGLILSGNTLYGAALYGGGSNLPKPYGTYTSGAGSGTVFAVNTDGTGFTVLYTFTTNSPISSAGTAWGLILSGNTLYRTNPSGGAYGSGTVFSIFMQPQLTLVASGSNAILAWPTNHAGFDYTRYALQSSTNLGSPVWNTNLPAPVVVNGLNTVTNPISGVQQFFRLTH